MILVMLPFYQLIRKTILYNIPIWGKTFLFQNDYAYIKYEKFLTIILSQNSNIFH